MFEAARLGDSIAHTSALTGFLVGAVIGVALIAAVGFTIATGGFGGCLIAGLLVGVGATVAAGALLETCEAIGGALSSPSGSIVTGSPNVFINGRPAAYATASTVACSKHNPVPLIAEGSSNVFINGKPAARMGDATTCGARIGGGSSNVFIGGGTVRYLEVDDEVPDWLRTTVDWAFALAGLVGGLAGLVKAAGGLSRALLPCLAKFTAGYAVGEAAGRYVIAPTVSRVYGGLVGQPVDVTTGRKVLLAGDEIDFTLPGPLPFECGRFYASDLAQASLRAPFERLESHALQGPAVRVGALGPGWVLPWEQRLTRKAGQLWLTDAQGRQTGFPLVTPGHAAFSEAEQKYLACTGDGRYILYDLTETYFDFGRFADEEPASTEPEGDADNEASLVLQRIEDRFGQWIALQREGDGRGRVRQILTSGGVELRLSYINLHGRLTQIERVAGRKRDCVAAYRYDNLGQLTTVTDARGEVVRRFAYEDGLMTNHSNALGFECRYRWKAMQGRARVIESMTSEGTWLRFSYDTEARRTEAEDELGRRACWRYDEHHQVIACADFDGALYAVDYNPSGHPTTLHLPAAEGRQRRVEFVLDAAGRIVSETDPLGRTTTTHYHGNSLRADEVRLPDGSGWWASYDRLGRLLATTDPLGRTEHHVYQEGSLSPWPVSFVDAKGGTQRFEWNRYGQLSARTDCSGKTTRYAHGFGGELLAVTNALGEVTRFKRLLTGQASAVTLPDGSAEGFEYDAAGLLILHRDRAGHERRWQRDARGQVLESAEPNGRRLHYRYDPQGRLIALQSGEGDEAAIYRFAYDAGDRLCHETRPDGIERRLHYDPTGELEIIATVGMPAAGSDGAERPIRLTRFERDVMGRLLQQATETAVIRYTWDAGDRLRQAERAPTDAGRALGVTANQVAFDYDPAGRLLAEHGANGSVAYTLDELDNVVSLALPHGQRIDWLHYGSGHVHQIRAGAQVVSDFERDDLHREVLRTQGCISERCGYDTLGRRAWQSAGVDGQDAELGAAGSIGARPPAPGILGAATPGLAPGQGQIWRTYRYSAEGELAEQQDSLRGALQFHYDRAGQLLGRIQPGTPGRGRAAVRPSQEQFAWDAAGNLLDAIGSGSRSDPGGGRTSAGRVEANRLRMWQDIRFDYDPWGNLRTKRKGSRQTQNFVFDAEDRLLAVRSIRSQGGSVESRFEYDALGRRIGRTDTPIEVYGRGPSEQRRFVWQGLRMVQEIGAISLSSYVYSPESPYTPLARLDALHDEALIARVVAAGSAPQAHASYFHTDPVGTPLELTHADGRIAWIGDYSAWGKVDDFNTALHNTTSTAQPLRLPGQYEDTTTGLHYNTFRYYDPDVGRFISQDPIGIEGGENLYGYAPNPTRWLDPLGWAPGDYGKMPNIPGYQKHHNISQGLAEHPAIRESGFDVHSSRNITRLPTTGGIDATRTIHNGMHTSDYDLNVKRQLDEIHRSRASPSIKRIQIEALSDKLGNQLRNKKIRLNAAC